MEILERIESQIAATNIPLFAITLAAVPCPDTPVILTLHWHGFLRERPADAVEGELSAFTPIPSSALQLNERWDDLTVVDRAAMEAAWRLGAWDIARAERPACTRAGADTREALECLQAFGAFPYGVNGCQVVVADTPDADDLLDAASRGGYLMWLFRPVHRSIWGEVADDATLSSDGTRELPCPVAAIPPSLQGAKKTVYRFGMETGHGA